MTKLSYSRFMSSAQTSGAKKIFHVFVHGLLDTLDDSFLDASFFQQELTRSMLILFGKRIMSPTMIGRSVATNSQQSTSIVRTLSTAGNSGLARNHSRRTERQQWPVRRLSLSKKSRNTTSRLWGVLEPWFLRRAQLLLGYRSASWQVRSTPANPRKNDLVQGVCDFLQHLDVFTTFFRPV